MASESDQDSASASASASAATGGQSKRPPLNHHASDQSDANTVTSSGHPHHRPKHQKQRHVGRLHGRVPSSSKVLHKPHNSSSRINLARKQGSPTDLEAQFAQRPVPHRRATSEVKLTQPGSDTAIPKSLSQGNLKRNRSHVEISKRTKSSSSDKLKRSASGTGIHKATKSQVHFDLGSDDPEDEWVDASGSNSPYLSRKGSLNSSTHSSFPPGSSAANSRPQTPSASTAAPAVASSIEESAEASTEESTARPELSSSPSRKATERKDYPTTRLLQRTSSHGAPPQMSTEMAKATPTHISPASTSHEPSPPTGSQQDGLISRFVEVVPGSGLTSEGSFYNPVRGGGSHRSEDLVRRPHSMANLSRSHEYHASEDVSPIESDISALVPKPARRTAAPSAVTSRTQQKLNLQRASSSLEPGQAVPGLGGPVGTGPLIGIGDPGHDGGNSRDPRVTKLLERTGMEYLVVRRHQNPIVRSLNRLSHIPGMDKTKRIPRTNTGSTTASKRSTDPTARHIRNISMPEGRQAPSIKRTASVKTNGAGSSYEGDDMSRLNERLSGSSLVGGEEEDGMTALLRNLWDKPMDLSASTD